jgi:hypothetical protein
VITSGSAEVVHDSLVGANVEELDVSAGNVDRVEEADAELAGQPRQSLALKAPRDVEGLLHPDRPLAVVVLEVHQAAFARAAAADANLGHELRAADPADQAAHVPLGTR